MSGTGLVEATVVHSGGARSLRDVTLLAEPGELLAVVGPSGSGKSTLLRAVAGLVPLRHGRVMIEGTDVTDRPPEARGVAMVFEQTGLVPFLDVAENLGFGLRLRHHPAEEIEDRVRAQARGLRLTRLLARRPATLSTGEQAQVGIGRALIRVPSLFLLDEPLGHHDARQRAEMRRHIQVVVKTLGVTTIYVTHDQAEALAIADRIAVLDAGTVVGLGTPRELYLRPANVLVAGFIGSIPITLLRVRLVVSAGGMAFGLGDRTLPAGVPVPTALLVHVGRPVLLGVRAEDVREADAQAVTDPATLSGVVTRLEYTGADSVATVALRTDSAAGVGPAAPGSGTTTGPEIRARLPRSSPVRPGSRIRIAVDVSRAHVFDPATGVALHHLAG